MFLGRDCVFVYNVTGLPYTQYSQYAILPKLLYILYDVPNDDENSLACANTLAI